MAARIHEQCEHYTKRGEQCRSEGYTLVEFADIGDGIISKREAWTCGRHFAVLKRAGLRPRVIRTRDTPAPEAS